MAKRKKKTVDTEVQTVEDVAVVEPKVQVVESSYIVKKLIANPLRLSMSLVLNNHKPFTLTEELLANEMFMMKIEQLISLEKLERV